MALQRLTIDGYGTFEPNNFSAPRTGRVETQCALDSTDFATMPCENGMLVAVDKEAGKVLLVDAAAITAKLPVAVVYSTEHLYDQFKSGMKNFATKLGEFYPRLGYPLTADTFTANAICYDDTEYATEELFLAALEGACALYGYASAVGAIQVTATPKATQPAELKVVKVTTMPDGQLGLKFQVLSV